MSFRRLSHDGRPPLRRWAVAGLVALGGSAFSAPARTEPPRAPAPAAADSAPPAAAPRPGPIADEAAKLAADVKRWGGRAGIVVVDVATGATLASHDEHASLNPASNAKLVTAAAALHHLGGAYRWTTGLYGKQQGDRVESLVLRGNGDPTLATSDLWQLARELAAAGVASVGSLSVDQSAFDDKFAPPAFESQPNEWAPFRAPVAAVSLDENTITISVRPTAAGKPAVVRVEPPGYVEVSGAVRTTAARDPEGVAVTLEPRADRLAARIGGHVPAAGRVVRIVRRADDPRLLAGHALRALLEQAGIRVEGPLALGGEADKRLLAMHRSAPLGAVLGRLGKRSDNFYAEMLWKTLAAEKAARPATAAAAADLATGYLEQLGAFEPGVVLMNGSGLFDANRQTARALATLLREAYLDPAVGPELVAQLSIGGVDGTLRARFASLAASRAVRAKTGTLAATTALSGYVLPPKGGSPVAFALLADGIAGKTGEARASIDRVVEAIAREVWKGAQNGRAAQAVRAHER